ncbi:hypothetical protein [Ralstonia sp.]|uniref:hypothetical protein n=1 Tax=Ralstonia sp. TaxID=54061 RepID=UPI002B7E0A5C|nr:hypothetical protein [Ralstonia sp.]HWV02971.1 hypothetical protein [Ralstonia sp.]
MPTELKMPEPLDPTKYYSRAEAKAHADAVAAYFAEKREQEMRERAQAEKATPHVRDISADEYEAMALKRYEAQQAKIAEREAAEKAKAQAEAEFMASRPATVQISESSPHMFLLKYAHWVSAGYSLPDDGVHAFTMGCYSATLHKATKAK